ncbi:iron-sulfur cluster assembly protein [Paenibacillus sp. EPM92]|uniref:iron-sulfur cluster assembly protein n=1 Tax=Paenibacillus sp. EPM92 TaxID=1561195 RepID=UPI001F3E367B|nr:iron-sulfur cluster assembly protein [Paenibacillus sp. EPM92]
MLMTKEQQVYKQLVKVYDPELDQPLTELGFIDHTKIHDDQVEVVFRLPTYWCSPNFAFIMAEDIRTCVSRLEWVREVKVNLIDHCASDEINQGVSKGKRFSESTSQFGASDGDLDELRRTFQIKAFYAREEKLIKHLLAAGWSNEAILAMTLEQLHELPLSEEGSGMREAYLEKKAQLHHSGVQAFTTPEGDALTLEGFSDYLLGAKRTRLSMEFNGHYCRGLLEARYDLEATGTEMS